MRSKVIPDHLSVLHDETHSFQFRDVGDRVSRDGDEISSTPPGKPLLHGERRRRRHILPFDEQFSLSAAGARQRDLEGFDRR